MNNDFNMDTSAVTDVSIEIAKYSKKYLGLFNEITAKVNGLATYWGGPVYDEFKARYQEYSKDLTALNELLDEFSKRTQETADSGAEMINNIESHM